MPTIKNCRISKSDLRTNQGKISTLKDIKVPNLLDTIAPEYKFKGQSPQAKRFIKKIGELLKNIK